MKQNVVEQPAQRFSGFLFLVLFTGSLVLLLPACSPPEDFWLNPDNETRLADLVQSQNFLVVTDENAGQEMALAADKVAAIVLPCNVSTGYRWEVSDLDDSKLQVFGSEIIDEGNGLLGAPGRQIFYVASRVRGAAEIRFSHLRPFKKAEVLSAAKFTFRMEGRFTANFVMRSREEPAPIVNLGISTRASLPSNYNWCDQNGCTPVKDQGGCGSCWAFSTVGVFESALKIQDGISEDLSEQYLVSCNDEGYGCDGGFFAHDYHVSSKVTGEKEAGAALESVFPYDESDVACNPPHAKAHKLQSWEYVVDDSTLPTVAEIKDAIYSRGPVAAAMCANTFQFNDYTGGIYSTNCSQLDHAIILVGWDDSSGVWYLRNSWGPSWGEDGYMRIKYGVGRVGYAANYVVYDGGGGTITANFNATVNGLSVTLADTSTATGSTINAWSWDFGDNGTSTSQNPSHTYAAAGTYTVSLTVTDANKNSDTISKQVSVSSPQEFVLFFSEYLEGSSNNKAVEIFNGGGQAISLQGCVLREYFNGATTVGRTIALGNTNLDPGAVFVVCHQSAATGILAKCNLSTGALMFNGNDSVSLYCKNGLVDATLDVIGKVGQNPGSAWGTAPNTTVDHTLVRKCSVAQGDSNGSDAFEPTVEWNIFSKNDFSHLGTRQGTCD